MGISTNITTESWGVDDKSWLANRKGLSTMRSITLDLSLFTTGDGFGVAPFPGFIPSGTVLAKVTATGLYGPYTPGAVNGLQTALGHLGDGVRLTDAQGNAFNRSGGPLFWEGLVIEANLPAFSGPNGELNAGAKTALPQVRYE